MTRKAQSALEYLMTYGWAILIIVIVGAALFALGVFNPQGTSPMSVTGVTNFQVVDAVITSDGNLTVILGTKAGKTTTVSTLNYTVEGTSCVGNAVLGTAITPSQSQTVTIAADSACSLTSGDKLNINPLTISYTVAGSSLTKTETGSILRISVQ